MGMDDDKPRASVTRDTGVERYKKMAREEVDQLTGMKRERARYHTGYYFAKTKVVFKPKKDAPKIHPFPLPGCMYGCS